MREFGPQVDRDRLLSITLLPCGEIDPAELNNLVRAFSAKGLEVRIAKERPLPQEAFNPRRQQYRADEILKVARSEPGDRVMAVTNCDLYADPLKFVFGLAESFGNCAVVSLYRLRIGVDEEKFRRRAVKESVHELGHMFGLAHCAKRSCVMFFSNTLGDTDRKETDWCEGCQRKLERFAPHLTCGSNKEVGYSHSEG